VVTSAGARGWTHVPELLSASEIQTVQADCEALRLLPDEQRRPGDKPHAGTHHLAELDTRSNLVKDIASSGRLLAAVALFVDPTNTMLRASYRCPQPGYGAQKLHTDALPKLDDGPHLVATAIIALVDFTMTNGSTRVIPGSHARPDLQRHAGAIDHHDDEHMLTCSAGSAFVFTGHLLHSGTLNELQHPRPALQLQWHAGGALATEQYHPQLPAG